VKLRVGREGKKKVGRTKAARPPTEKLSLIVRLVGLGRL